MDRQFKITFLPVAAEAWVPEGVTLLQAAAVANVAIDAPCGDRGICGRCRVQVLAERTPPSLPERTLIPREDLEKGWRLACQTRVSRDATVRVPLRALQPVVVPLAAIQPKPAVRKTHLAMPAPTLEDPLADLGRLCRQLGGTAEHLLVDLRLLRRLPRVLDEAGYDVTAVAVGDRLAALEPGDTTARCFGLAVDLGTTSVVVMLADLNSGRLLGVESRLNGQANYGADVISRINATMESGTVGPLQQAAIATINSALDTLLETTGVDRDEVYEAVVVGNTCMSHLLLGLDPRGLAMAPYQPVVTDPLVTPAADLGFAINPGALVYTLPNVSGFVGSDTVGVVLAAGLHRSAEIKLAIDFGTNGEMVLGNRDRLVACSTAAGPAFEGARISQGMRATAGAIERVWIDDGGEVRLQVIGGGQPLGICGSGLLDAVAQMRRAGVLGESGRLMAAGKAGPDIPDRLARRLLPGEKGGAFLLDRRGRRQVALTQADVREFQLAKGAVRAGIAVLLTEYGIELSEVSEILLAGAFGSYLNPASAREIDLVPDVPLERITAVGNAAGQGALMALLSTDLREEAAEIARFVQYVELSARPDFMDHFVAAMSLKGTRDDEKARGR